MKLSLILALLSFAMFLAKYFILEEVGFALLM